MTKKVIITIGIFGVGKSYQSEQWIKKHPEYITYPCNNIPIEELAKGIMQHDYVIMDYYFNKDPFAEKLKQILQCEVEFWILFDKPEVIVQRQLSSKPPSYLSPKDCWLVWEVYMGQLVPLYDLPETRFFDGQMKQYTKDEFITTFKSFYDVPSKEEVKKFLVDMDKKPGYDKYYHHFNLPHGIRIGKDGYARNEETWEVIKDWVDWKDKYVLELCSFHAYFSQQMYKSGAKPSAMDISTTALYTAAVFAKWNSTRFNLYNYNLDDLSKRIDDNVVTSMDFARIPTTRKEGKDWDIVILFNVLHHLQNKDKILKTMAKYPMSLFEINISNRPLVETYFKVIKEAASPKDNRVLLMCVPK